MLETKVKLEVTAESIGGKTTAIIVSAGSSLRMGKIDKTVEKLLDKPIIVHSLLAFENSKEVDNIVVVTRKELVLKIQNFANEYGIKKVTDIVEGGDCREQSVINGVLAAADADILLIHDGARPLVTDNIICSVKNATELYGAAIPAVKVKDTIKITDEGGKVICTPKRENLISVQTPQGVRTDIFRCAAAAFKGELNTVTDDSTLIELNGNTVYAVEGSYENIKITTAEDLITAENILKSRGEKL